MLRKKKKGIMPMFWYQKFLSFGVFTQINDGRTPSLLRIAFMAINYLITLTGSAQKRFITYDDTILCNTILMRSNL